MRSSRYRKVVCIVLVFVWGCDGDVITTSYSRPQTGSMQPPKGTEKNEMGTGKGYEVVLGALKGCLYSISIRGHSACYPSHTTHLLAFPTGSFS
jgi:hypothetical protein